MPTYTIQESSQTQSTTRTLSDSEAKSYFPAQVLLSANKQTIAADGVDFATINVQIKSVPLSNNLQDNLSIAQKVVLLIADIEVELLTDNTGFATHEIAANDAGVYNVSARNLASNVLTITGV